MRKHTIARYGWKPDAPDFRDYQLTLPGGVIRRLPDKVDLSASLPPAYDQQNCGSCTGNATAGHIQFVYRKQGEDFMPSRLFLYYNGRDAEGTAKVDAGASLRDVIKGAAHLGACSEASWPYEIGKFANKPGTKCYTEASEHQAITYFRVPRTRSFLRGCLAAGYPFVFGFAVYESFESPKVAKSGIVPMPSSGEQMLGGHAVLAVGYDDTKGMFFVRNSWGTGWGQKGHFWMPYEYFLNPQLSGDFWTIRKMES